MPTVGHSGEGRTCTRRNSGLAILEVSGGQNQFPSGQADLINCPLYSGPGRRLSETPRTFWLRCLPFQGQMDKKEGNLKRVGRKGGGRIMSSTLPALHLCLRAPGASSWANFLALVKVWGAFQIAQSGPQGRSQLQLPPPSPSRCLQSHPRGKRTPGRRRDQGHAAGAHLESAPRA